MKFRIHYTISGVEDSVVISGNDEKEVASKAEAFFTERGYTSGAVGAWSEVVE